MKLRWFESIITKWGINIDRGLVLDIGCGNGRISLVVKKTLPQAELVSLDLSKTCVKHVKENISDEAIVVDGTRLPIRDESANLIVCDQMIEHIERQDDLVREMSRVLKTRGNILVGSVLRRKFALSPYRNREGKMTLSPDHLREFESNEQYTSLFRDRFEILEISTIPITHPLLITLYNVLFSLGLVKSDLYVRLQRHNPELIYKDSLLTLITIPRPRFSYIYILAEKKRCRDIAVAKR